MAWSKAHRVVFHDVHFSRFQGKAQNRGYGNSSIIMYVKNSHKDVAIVNCLQTGQADSGGVETLPTRSCDAPTVRLLFTQGSGSRRSAT